MSGEPTGRRLLAGWLLLFNWLKKRKERKAQTAALALRKEVA